MFLLSAIRILFGGRMKGDQARKTLIFENSSPPAIYDSERDQTTICMPKRFEYSTIP